jgi:hypothetical protein
MGGAAYKRERARTNAARQRSPGSQNFPSAAPLFRGISAASQELIEERKN